jgi:hypothetical protein
MKTLLEKIKEEFKAMIPPTLFFFFALHVVALMRTLMLKSAGIQFSTSVSIALAALVIGKAVLIADFLPFVNRYPDKPLVYNIGWKTLIYSLVAFVIHYLEHLVDFWKEAGSLLAGNAKLLAEIVWRHFWAIQMLLVVLLLMFCTMRESTRVLGVDKVKNMFFGVPTKVPTV